MNINCRKVLDCGLSRDGLLPKKEVLILCDIRMHSDMRELRLNHMKERKEKKIRKKEEQRSVLVAVRAVLLSYI